MQDLKSIFSQLGFRLLVVAFLLTYGMQVIGLEQVKLFSELDIIELSLDSESDGEEKKSVEDLDDHLSQGVFSEQNLYNIDRQTSFFISEMAQKAHLDPGYPPPEAA